MNETEAVLDLAPPRWPLLWPLAGFLSASFSGTFNFAAHWQSAGWEKGWWIFWLALQLGFGCSIYVSIMVGYWKRLRLVGDELLVTPPLVRPVWMLTLFFPSLARQARKGELRLPRAGLTLEWVGKTLLLHGPGGEGLRLGRGARAETIAAWFAAQGFGKPVGRP